MEDRADNKLTNIKSVQGNNQNQQPVFNIRKDTPSV